MDTLAFAQKLIALTPFFAGVPDSLLKDLCAALEQIVPKDSFQTTANEGAAVALSAGYTLASGKPGCVYMQNSGLGNAINPLLSLNDPLVYSIPVLLVIGWRGQPGVPDEPQHLKQGIVTEALLDACDIPYRILSGDMDEATQELAWAGQALQDRSGPVALLVPKGVFDAVPSRRSNRYSLKRERAIEIILDAVKGRDVRIVSTTGMISRELYELREKRGETHANDFLTVGSMGHTSQIALGVAMQRPSTTVICLDGDGAALMHMGAMAVIGASGTRNYVHIVLNNEAHDSVGGQSTCAGHVDWPTLAASCGYDLGYSVDDEDGLPALLGDILSREGKRFLEVKAVQGARADLGRPGQVPRQCKEAFAVWI